LRETCGDNIASFSIQGTRQIPRGQEGLFAVTRRALERRKNEEARKRGDLVTIMVDQEEEEEEEQKASQNL